MKKPLSLIAGIIFLSLFILILTMIEPYKRQKNLCRITEEYRKEPIRGYILNKYLDEDNHMSETVIIQSAYKGKTKKKDLTLDHTGLYGYISIGDSLYKPSGTLRTLVVRGNEKNYFILDFGCEKTE